MSATPATRSPPSHPQRLYYTREARGHRYLVGALALAVIVAAATFSAALPLAVLCCLIAGGLAAAAARQYRLATRAAIGAHSETRIRAVLDAAAPVLNQLAREITGDPAAQWRIEHSVELDCGDLDHVLLAPAGPAILVETKTQEITRAHIMAARRSAQTFSRDGALAVWSIIVRMPRTRTRRVDGCIVCSEANLISVIAELYRSFHTPAPGG